MDAVISLRSVTKSFGAHTVLRDPSFDIPRGQITAVMGPSGTGKSVLLKNIIGLLSPDAGEFWVEGSCLDELVKKIQEETGATFTSTTPRPTAMRCSRSRLRRGRRGVEGRSGH